MVLGTSDVKKRTVRMWLVGAHACTLVVSKEFARQHGLDETSQVVIEGVSEGILVKRIDF